MKGALVHGWIYQNAKWNYQLIYYRIKENIIVFEIASNKRNCTCPYCGMASSGVHSNYQREIQDLPIQNNQIILFH